MCRFDGFVAFLLTLNINIYIKMSHVLINLVHTQNSHFHFHFRAYINIRCKRVNPLQFSFIISNYSPNYLHLLAYNE